VIQASVIERRSLLYRSKVEYGGWTINHVQGCSHGCRYPCYAMLLAKRVGRVKDYAEWTTPSIVGNALELLDDEIERLRGRLDTVHLSFTTDPFMYSSGDCYATRDIAALSRRIITRLNEAAIPVTTLTKGVYPDELATAAGRLHCGNEYGVSLVSLSESFREVWEPGAAPIAERVASLRRLADRGCRTWASIEPYPTPNIDPAADRVEDLLEALSFVDRVVFGKWNYNRLASAYERDHDFFGPMAERVARWCERYGTSLHIKRGTPGSKSGEPAALAR